MSEPFSEYLALMVDGGENPIQIPDDDPLLRQLLIVHSDRRYEALHFEKGKYKRKIV